MDKSAVISEPEDTTPTDNLILSNNSVITPSIEVDSDIELDLKENGFRSTRRMKLVCTVGPACCSSNKLEALAMGGMNVAKLNMCHGTRDWHRDVIRSVRKLNLEKVYTVAIMIDTEGSEIHMGDLGDGVVSVKAELMMSLHIPHLCECTNRCCHCNFIHRGIKAGYSISLWTQSMCDIYQGHCHGELGAKEINMLTERGGYYGRGFIF